MRLPVSLHSLKFRIVAMAVATGLLAALGTAHLVLGVTQQEVQRMLLDSASDDRERFAALLSGKLETLKTSLAAVARQAPAATWSDAIHAQLLLLDRPALGSLFDTLFVAAPDGQLLAYVDGGHAVAGLPSIVDRHYFQRAMQSDQPVVSEPLQGKLTHEPLVVVAVPVLNAEGRHVAVVAGALRLRSNSLFTDSVSAGQEGTRDLVIDRQGQIVSHTDTRRVLGHARDEPGLAAVFARWHAAGSPIETLGQAEMVSEHLVSMAGIPLSDWTLVRLTPLENALTPLVAARRTAWLAAMGAGLLAGLLAGALAWAVVRPIAQLRDRAQRMLHAGEAAVENWPSGHGEIGAMSQAFQLLLTQRERQRLATQDLLHQLHAVLDNAEVGIALTRNGCFEIVSRQFCAIFQCEREQAIGQPTRMIYASDAAYAELSSRAEPAFLQHGMFDGEVELVRRNGDAFWAHMRGRAVVPGDRSQGTIWVIADVTQAHRQREQLNWAASHDRLTSLTNRAAFEAHLELAVADAAARPFCALFIDLDRFKQVNDTGGHAAGDALLRGIAKALVGALRSGDVVARLGGDEFVVVLPGCSQTQAQAVAEKLRDAVDAYQLEWQGLTHRVGASIGLVRVNGSHANAAEVMAAADAACYQAKRAGRNQVALA
ncbi:MAG: diguanylate cyclase [Burkholderiales bacterium]|nr:diguanylate cyclase [Burkholderiales bacterium]